MLNEVVLECKCHLRQHVAVMSFYEDDGKHNDLVITVALNHYLPWYKRLVTAIFYIFGSTNTFNHYDEVLVKNQDLAKLKNLVDKYYFSNGTVRSKTEEQVDRLEQLLAEVPEETYVEVDWVRRICYEVNRACNLLKNK